jgi:uncharacterized protein (TIGR02611 family)
VTNHDTPPGSVALGIAVDLAPAPRSGASQILRFVRKGAVTAAGAIVLAAGVALLFLPGPAILVIPLGLAILATEYPWARRLLHRVKARLARILRRPRAPASAGAGAQGD